MLVISISLTIKKASKHSLPAPKEYSKGKPNEAEEIS